MKKIIIVISLVLLVFTSCTKENKLISEVQINGNNYMVPLISTNFSEVKASLSLLTDNIETIHIGEDVILKAEIDANSDNLFVNIYYEFIDGGVNGINLSYKINPSIKLTLNQKRDLVSSINSNSNFKL